MKTRRRQSMLQLHRWTGLSAGLVCVAVSCPGSARVFRAQLEPALVPAMAAPPCAAPLPLDVLAARAHAASPGGGPLKMVRLYSDPHAAARLRLSDGRWMYIDPCSAKVGGAQALYGGPFGTIAQVHIGEFPGVRDWAAGSLALLFAAGILAGAIVVLRPATLAHLKRGLTFRRGLHQGLALYAAPVLLVSAVTGAMQTFEWGATPAQAPGAAPAAAALPLAQLLARAKSVVPDASKIQIRLPGNAAAPATFEMVARDAPHANAFSYVYLDPASGAVLGHVPHAANPLGHKLYLLGAGVHYGWVGGLTGQLLLLAGALSAPVLAWTGTASYLRTRRRKAERMRLTIASISCEAEGVCAFELVHPDGKPLPRFEAGSHLQVYIGPGLVRHYSLCNHPDDTRRYLIGVLRTDDSRGGSRAMHALRQGDTLEVSRPRNHFALAPSARHSLLIAGGIGITPILCMAEQLASRGANFEMHYCARSEERAAFRKRIAGSPFAQRVRFYFGQEQRIDLSALMARPAPGTHLYVCGPAGFIDAVLAAAHAAGWPDECVHREFFAGAVHDAREERAFDVKLASSGKVVHVAPGVSALAALEAAGVAMPSSCLQGVCGTCVTGVLEGEPEHRDLVLTTVEKARNDCFTPCCSRARSAVLTLDL